MSPTATPSPRRRNPRGAGHTLRADILAAVRDTVVTEGYASAITMRGVARKVGVAAPSIYPHFSDPDEMVQAVVVQTFAELGAAVERATADITDPRERLVAGCRAYLRFGIDNPELYGLIFRRNRLLRGDQPRPDGDTPDTRDPDAGPFASLVDGIRRCIADGSSTATDALPTAVQLWAAMHGLVLLRGNDYQFPWPDLDRLETDLITANAHLRPAP